MFSTPCVAQAQSEIFLDEIHAHSKVSTCAHGHAALERDPKRFRCAIASRSCAFRCVPAGGVLTREPGIIPGCGAYSVGPRYELVLTPKSLPRVCPSAASHIHSSQYQVQPTMYIQKPIDATCAHELHMTPWAAPKRGLCYQGKNLKFCCKRIAGIYAARYWSLVA